MRIHLPKRTLAAPDAVAREGGIDGLGAAEQLRDGAVAGAALKSQHRGRRPDGRGSRCRLGDGL
jgi:hypothetical protein